MSPGKTNLTISAETAYPESTPSARVRIAAFAPHLRALGVDLRYRPTLTEREYSILTATGHAARKAAALGTAAVRFATRSRTRTETLLLIHRLRFIAPVPGLEPSRHVDVYDFDDALFVGSILSANRRFRWLKQEAARHRAYLKRARLVIAGNSYLASHAREFGRRVEVVPSCVDPNLQATRDHEPRDVVTVGWIGSRSTSGYLDHVLPVFSRLNADRERARLVVVGGGRSYSNPWVESRPWTLASQPVDLASFDIGIMPMPDTPWTRGKCGYKLLQYFAAGVPAIASPVGVNVDLIGDERGLLATNQTDWLRALDELVADAAMRRAMGSDARAFVEREHSYARWAPELSSLLSEL